MTAGFLEREVRTFVKLLEPWCFRFGPEHLWIRLQHENNIPSVPAKELCVPAAGTEPHYGRPVPDSAQAAAGAALVMVICEHCHHCTSPTPHNPGFHVI